MAMETWKARNVQFVRLFSLSTDIHFFNVVGPAYLYEINNRVYNNRVLAAGLSKRGFKLSDKEQITNVCWGNKLVGPIALCRIY